jgi:hypothetical protein
MSEVTYGRLDKVLHSLGFSARTTKDQARVYQHTETGALIVLPVFPPEDKVLPRHLLAVRSILDAYGIADLLDFAAKLQTAS